MRFLRTSFHQANLSNRGTNFNCLLFLLFPHAICLVQSLKAISWIINCIIRNPKWTVRQSNKFKFLMHNFLMPKYGKLCWGFFLDCKQVQITYFSQFWSIYNKIFWTLAKWCNNVGGKFQLNIFNRFLVIFSHPRCPQSVRNFCKKSDT